MSDTPTVATIHLAAIQANFVEAKRLGERDVIAVIKADAYGHGATRVARAIVEAGCRRLAVATVSEAVPLREAEVEVPILVLGGASGVDESLAAVDLGLTPVIHHLGHVRILAQAAHTRGEILGVEVEVDTGMRRMGIPPEQAVGLLESIAAEPTLRLDGLYTHFARADELDPAPTIDQCRQFREVISEAEKRDISLGVLHAANSAGLLEGDGIAAVLPRLTATRPGLMLYGAAPTSHRVISLRPAMTLRTRVAHVREVKAGEAVGYSALYRARRDTRIATLFSGYAQGVPVSASGQGAVLIRGQKLPIVGRVSMDFTGVDVGRYPVEIGDEAIFFGEAQGDSRISVEEAAVAAQTIPYELLVRVGSRVRREYEEGA